MFIEPNSDIKIYRSIPLDTDYNHTLYFANVTQQNAYFHGNINNLKYTLTSQSYQRVTEGKMKVEKNALDLYDCNYMAFRNTSFGQKWFYAFITKVEYINNSTCEIDYSIDIMQTYFLDVTLKHCFVEREHSLTDNIGDNLVEEKIDFGYYITDYTNKTNIFNAYSCVVCTSYDTDLEDGYAHGNLYYGIYSGLRHKRFFITDVSGNPIYGSSTKPGINNLNQWLEAMDKAGKINAIVNMSFVPSIIYGLTGTEGTYLKTTDNSGTTTTGMPVYQNRSYFYNQLDGYTPVNKKLYTYPYNTMYIHGGDGNGNVLRLEHFNTDSSGNFIFRVDGTSTSQAIISPENYLGVNGKNYQQSISISTNTECAYSSDYFKQYSALHSNSTAMKMVGAIGAGAASAIGSLRTSPTYSEVSNVTNLASGGEYLVPSLVKAGVTVGLGASGGAGVALAALGVAGMIGGLLDQKQQPPINHGAESNDTMIACGGRDFYIEHRCINNQYAKIVDSYFTRYGYAVNITKVPSISNRPHWNYIKTNGCLANGNIPASALTAICRIFDRGITFWKNASEVGNYSLNNSP